MTDNWQDGFTPSPSNDPALQPGARTTPVSSSVPTLSQPLPGGNPNGPPPVAAPAVPNDEIRANMEMAKAASDPTVLGLIQQSAQLQQFLMFKRIETQEQYDQAIDAFAASKGALKELDRLRHSYVDFPTKVVKLTNGFFKSVADGIEKAKVHIGGIIQAKKAADDAIARAAAEKAAQQQQQGQEQQPIVGEDGQVTFGNEPPPPPSNVVESAKGAKVHSRTTTEAVVVDLKAFLKTIAGINKRFDWLFPHIEEVVEVKTGVLMRLMKENKKKSVPGVEVRTESRVV